MWFWTLLSVLTGIKFVVFWMIFLLLPSMAVLAFVLVWTSILVVVDKRSWTPIWALIFWVDIKLRLSSEILPIVSKHTLVSLMIIFIVRTPNSFEVKHVKVWVFFELVYQFNWYLRLRMSERAEVPILAFPSSINVRRAEFGFILIRVIKFLYSIVSFLAIVPIHAFFTLCCIVAHLGLVRSQWSSLVFFLIMIVWATLQIMAVGI